MRLGACVGSLAQFQYVVIIVLLFLLLLQHYETVPVVELHDRFLALESTAGQLGSQLFHLCSGHAIARKLRRRHYVRTLYTQGAYIGGYMAKIEAVFPRLANSFTILEAKNEHRIPFAYKNGVKSCCEYEDPYRVIGRTEQFLVLDTQLGQNSQYFEDMLPELHQLLEFSSDRSVMCAHIRRKDFRDLNVASDFNRSIHDIHEIASQQGLSNVLLFGEDLGLMKPLGELLIGLDKSGKREVQYSFNSEEIDFYLASRACGAFLITAPTSAFGWWLAFFIQNQDAVFYSNDSRGMADKVIRKDLFLYEFASCLKN
ncbi:unnamed protein product [Angiostrongylus costaricensis]|uniref:L-Fucosyltransferase n=1 Tax=Angiostrongylus costaricensis TaxID=334426 RepID=A0A0R3PDY2_ANGCS|nr:unnamed protein product [Angiostrongylus costaricensis]